MYETTWGRSYRMIIKSCRQGFYGFQLSAGLCDSGMKPYTAAHMWKVAVHPVLLYACQSVPLDGFQCLWTAFNKCETYPWKHMDMLQAKLIKASVGLSKYLRTTPLLNAKNEDTNNIQNDINSTHYNRGKTVYY